MMNPSDVLVVSDGEAFSDAVADAVDAVDASVRAAPPAAVEDAEADCVVCDATVEDFPSAVERLREADAHLPVVAVGDEAFGRTAAAADARWVPESNWEATLPGRVEAAVARYREHREARERETFFAALTEDAPYATVVLDAAETVRYASPAVTDLLGYRPDELVGNSVDEIIPETFQERHERAMERFVESGVRHLDWSSVDLVARHREGEDVPVNVSLGTAVRGGERYFGAVLRAESAPAEESARFRKHEAFSESVFENTSDVILVVDAESGSVIEVNPAASDTLGYDYRTLMDADLSGLFVEGDPPEPESGRVSVTVRTADDNERVLDVAAATLTYEGESALLYSGSDVTERRRRAAELERQNERLESFTGIVSHDLRNPLNLAMANADLVADGHLDRIDVVRDALDDMEALIDDLLTLAQQGRVVAPEEFETFQLASAAREAWNGVDTPDGSELRVDDDSSVRGDRDRTEQALANLVRNSVEHGATDGSVTVTVGELDDGTGFYVEDDGPGIPVDDRENVLDAGYTTADGGTGYGLAIVAEIAEAHGWDVSVTEGVSGGARFEFRGVDTVRHL